MDRQLQADHYIAFPYLYGMVTLVLTEEGWESEGMGTAWAHWEKGEKLIYVRGFGPPEDRRVPFGGQGGVSQEELDALAERLVRATGWKLDRTD